MSLKYDDFDLLIEPYGDKYRVRLNGPAGQAAADFTLPFTDLEVGNFLGRIGQVRRSTRRSDAPELRAAKEFGSKLFNAVFSGELIAQLRGSIEQSLNNDHGLRIRLRLTDAPELADLPWEFLYDAAQNHFLTTSTETPLVRFLDLPQRITPLRATLPLRVLVVIAGPRNLKRLDAEGEWERLQDALGDLLRGGHIVLERLPAATIDALRLRARGAPFHIFHFIGHGGFDSIAEDGVLQFEDDNGMSYPVRGEMLGMQLHDHRSLRLAVLNACEGARSSRQDPFSGVAQSLLQQRVPAVIAMQFEISDAAAKVFAREFYRAIAEGNPVDAAVCESRKALFNEEFGQEWATPVLYMRSQEGTLFELEAPPAGVSDAKAAEAERLEAERRFTELAAAERVAARKAEAERAAAAEKERQAQESTERERRAQEAKETERRATEKAEAERVAAAEKERQVREKSEQELLKRKQAARVNLGADMTPSDARSVSPAPAPTPTPPPRQGIPLWQVFAITVPVAGLFVALSWHHLRPYTDEARTPEPQAQQQIAPSPVATQEIPAAQKSVDSTASKPPQATPAKTQDAVLHSPPKPAKAASAEAPKAASTTPSLPPASKSSEPAAPTRLRVSGISQADKLVNKVVPMYPAQAARENVSGKVELHVILAKDGTVQSLDVISGDPLLQQSAQDAVKQWRYSPTLVNNQPVEVETTVTVAYKLNAPPAPVQTLCTLGTVALQEQEGRLVGSVPFTYPGSSDLQTLAVRGVPLTGDKQQIQGPALGQSTLKIATGTASFSIESHPSLGHAGQQGEYVLVSVTVKSTGEALCTQLVPYRRTW